MSEVEPKRSEEDQAFMDYVYAIRRRDFEAADKLIPKMKFPACHLMAGKKLFGAEFIRKYGYNTEEADKKYGPGWLDRDDGPPALPSFRAFGRLSRMTAASDVLRAVYSLASIETRSVLKHRDQTEAIDRDETRQEIRDLLLQASRQQDIDAILELERILLLAEREYLDEAPKKVASLNNGLEELDAALTALAGVRNQDSYREIASQHYSLSKNQLGGLPRDQARQFFKSHQARFRNLGKGRMEDSERALLAVRAGNIKIAETLYKELQQQALGIEDLTGANP